MSINKDKTTERIMNCLTYLLDLEERIKDETWAKLEHLAALEFAQSYICERENIQRIRDGKRIQ